MAESKNNAKKKASKGGKLSLQKKSSSAKQTAIENLISVSTTDLNETNDFKPSTKVDLLPGRKNIEKSEAQPMFAGSEMVEVEKISRKQGREYGEKEVAVKEESLCPSCKVKIPKKDFPAHIKHCFTQQYGVQSKRSTQSKEVLVKDDVKQAEVHQKVEENLHEHLYSDDVFFCHVCQKDLSRMNSQRKAQHINRCADKVENEKLQEEEIKRNLQAARFAVLDCAICGKPFKAQNARKNHLKSCAQKNKVPTEQMLRLVRTQEEEHQLKVDAGILPNSNRDINSKQPGKAVGRKRKVKEPKNQLDEDMQMAMAISTSLIEQNQDLIAQMNIGNRSEVEIETKKGKKRKVNEEDIPLLMLSEEEKQKRMADKITMVFMAEEEDDEDIDCTPIFQESKLQGHHSCPRDLELDTRKGSSQVPLLWDRCSLQDDESASKELYYVQSLMPPITMCNVAPGSKLKRLSEIPGRARSKIRAAKESSRAEIASVQTESSRSETADDLIASTQTVVVLAELAATGSEEDDDEELIQSSGFCPEKPIKVKAEHVDGLSETLSGHLMSLVNNPECSDVQIMTADNCSIYAHRIFLMARCPKLLQMVDGDHILMSDVSSETVLSLLKYVYAGEVHVTSGSLDAVYSLCEVLELEELKSVCQKIRTNLLEESQNALQEEENPELRPAAVRSQRSSVDEVLREMWSESSESEGEASTNAGAGSHGEEKDDGISMEDYYDIMCTQRQKLGISDNSKNTPRKTKTDNCEKESLISRSVSVCEDIEKNKFSDDLNENVNSMTVCNRQSIANNVQNSSLQHEVENTRQKHSDQNDHIKVTKNNLSEKNPKEDTEFDLYRFDEKLLTPPKTKLLGAKGGGKLGSAHGTNCNSKVGQDDLITSYHLEDNRISRDGNDQGMDDVIICSGESSGEEPDQQSLNDHQDSMGGEVVPNILTPQVDHPCDFVGRSTSPKMQERLRIDFRKSFTDNGEAAIEEPELVIKKTTQACDKVNSQDHCRLQNIEIHTAEVKDTFLEESELIFTKRGKTRAIKYSEDDSRLTDNVNQNEVMRGALDESELIVNKQKPPTIKYCESDNGRKNSVGQNEATRAALEASELIVNKCGQTCVIKYSEDDSRLLDIDNQSEVTKAAQMMGKMEASSAYLNSSGADLFSSPCTSYEKNSELIGKRQRGEVVGRVDINQINRNISNCYVALSPLHQPIPKMLKYSTPVEASCDNEGDRKGFRTLSEHVSLALSPVLTKHKIGNFMVDTPETVFSPVCAEDKKANCTKEQTGLSSPALTPRTQNLDSDGKDTVHKIDHGDDDLEILSDNFAEISQEKSMSNSPTFSSKDKVRRTYRPSLDRSRKEHCMAEIRNSPSNEDCPTKVSPPNPESTGKEVKKSVKQTYRPSLKSPRIESQKQNSYIENRSDSSPNNDISHVNTETLRHSFTTNSPVNSSNNKLPVGRSPGILRESSIGGVSSPTRSPSSKKTYRPSLRKSSCEVGQRETGGGEFMDDSFKLSGSPMSNKPENSGGSEDEVLTISPVKFSSAVTKCPQNVSTMAADHQLSTGSQDAHGAESNVWEDFDDCGAGFVDLVSCDMPETPKKEKITDEGQDEVSSPNSAGSPVIPHCDDVNQLADDSFMWSEDNAPGDDTDTMDMSEQEMHKPVVSDTQDDNFKTPVAAQRQAPEKKKKWVPPSPFTPQPDYDTMATPQLKKEVQKFGVRPISKKRMLLVLKDIHKQTHQYETDSEVEEEQQDLKKIEEESEREDSISSSQESSTSDLAEESFVASRHGEDLPASQQGSGLDLHRQLFEYIHSKPELYTQILMYQPLGLDNLKKELKEAGIKCSMDRLMAFLDEKCITFTMKNQDGARGKGGARGRGKKRKTSSQE